MPFQKLQVLQNRSSIPVAAILVFLYLGSVSFGQEPSTVPVATASEPNTFVSIEGLVVAREKYSFTVDERGRSWTVRLTHQTPIALKFTRPWFDWDNHRVLVDATSKKNEPGVEPKRVPFQLPSNKLYIISRLITTEQPLPLDPAIETRLNFYLVTPTNIGQHIPTKKEPYVSGQLSYSGTESPVEILIDSQTFPVILGFRRGTMNGFSIANLQPNTTQVVLSGKLNPAGEIVAESVLFFPLD